MNIKKAEKKLKDVDSFLTTLGRILKKHWKILAFILFCYLVYEMWTMEDEYITDEQYDEYYEDTTTY